MRLNQASIYKIGAAWPVTVAQLESALSEEPFVECAATQQKSTGWVPPRGPAHGALVEAVGGQWVARWRADIKTVPSAELQRAVQARCAEIEAETGRLPGKREQRDLRDDALLALLPHAFARRVEVWVWIDRAADLMILGTASQARADDVISHLVRVAKQAMAVSLLQTKLSPQAAMSGWLAAESDDELPTAFHVGRECELKGIGEEPAVVKFSRHHLDTEEVRQHIREGKLPTRLALGWNGRVIFTLTRSLQLRKIGFLDSEFNDSPGRDEDRFDADVALTTGELRGLIADLLYALGGEERENQ